MSISVDGERNTQVAIPVRGVLALKMGTAYGVLRGGVSERFGTNSIDRLIATFKLGVDEGLYPALLFPGHDGIPVGRVTEIASDARGVAYRGELTGENNIVASVLRRLDFQPRYPVSPTIKGIRRVRDPQDDDGVRLLVTHGWLFDIAILSNTPPAYFAWIELERDARKWVESDAI